MTKLYKIIWIVRAFWLVYKCFHSAMRHENGCLCLQVVRSYSFMKEIQVYILALYIVFPFVMTENNNFIKEIKHVISAFIAWWKPRKSLRKFSSRWNSRLRLGFLLMCSRILPNVRLGFYQAMKARRNVLFLKWMEPSRFIGKCSS